MTENATSNGPSTIRGSIITLTTSSRYNLALTGSSMKQMIKKVNTHPTYPLLILSRWWSWIYVRWISSYGILRYIRLKIERMLNISYRSNVPVQH